MKESAEFKRKSEELLVVANKKPFSYPRNFGVKARMAKDLAEFLGSSRQFREIFSDKTREDGRRHIIYTPQDIRRLRFHVLGADADFVPTPTIPPIIVTHMSKGGVGKTTLSSNLAVSFSLLGLKTLIIDTDPQGSASEILGVDTAEEDVTHLGDLLWQDYYEKEIDFSSAIKSIYPGNMLDLLPADITLAGSISWMDHVSIDEGAFKRLLETHVDFFSQYDVILIDTAPSTSKLTQLVISAADKEMLTPVTTDGQSIKALRVISSVLIGINDYRAQHGLSIVKPLIVANAFRPSKDSLMGINKLRVEFEELLYPHAIPHSPAFSRQFSLTERAPNENLPGVERNPTSLGAGSVIQLAKFLVSRFDVKLNGIPNNYAIRD